MQGGFRRDGFLAVDGNEVIALIYDLEGPQYRTHSLPQPEQIRSIEFLMLLANDYRIDVTSNRQLNSTVNQYCSLTVFLSASFEQMVM